MTAAVVVIHPLHCPARVRHDDEVKRQECAYRRIPGPSDEVGITGKIVRFQSGPQGAFLILTVWNRIFYGRCAVQ